MVGRTPGCIREGVDENFVQLGRVDWSNNKFSVTIRIFIVGLIIVYCQTGISIRMSRKVGILIRDLIEYRSSSKEYK